MARFKALVRVCLPVAFVLFRAGELRAEEGGRSPLAEYHAPASCPPSSVFSEQAAARTALWQSAELVVRVELQLVAGGAAGRVRLERGGTRTEREITGAGCDEVVRALALIVAILIDPSADTRPLPERPAPSRVEAEPREPPPAPARFERAWFVYAGVELALQGALAPELVPGQRVFAGALHRSPSALLSSVRLSWLGLESGTISAGGGASASFELGGVRLEGCSSGAGSRTFRLNPCLFVEAGRLASVGLHPVRPNTEVEVWAALGPALRGSAWLKNTLFFELEAGAVIPLTRFDFAFEGERPLQETPVLAAEFAAALGVRFP